MLVRLDPDANATTRAVDPARPEGRLTIPGGGCASAEDQRRLHRRRPKLLTAKVHQSSCSRIPINHVINVNFGGFRDAVDAIGCVYTDVDRRYYNSNLGCRSSSTPRSTSSPATRSCAAQKALDYVRFRHARHRLRARRAPAGLPAPGQVAVRRSSRFISDPHKLTSKIGKHMRTDAALQSKEELLKLATARRLLGRATRSARCSSRPPTTTRGAARSSTATPEVARAGAPRVPLAAAEGAGRAQPRRRRRGGHGKKRARAARAEPATAS